MPPLFGQRTKRALDPNNRAATRPRAPQGMAEMNIVEIATLEHASRSVMAYVPDDRPANLAKLMTAVVPALGILAACALTLFAIV